MARIMFLCPFLFLIQSVLPQRARLAPDPSSIRKSVYEILFMGASNKRVAVSDFVSGQYKKFPALTTKELIDILIFDGYKHEDPLPEDREVSVWCSAHVDVLRRSKIREIAL